MTIEQILSKIERTLETRETERRQAIHEARAARDGRN